jgi:hypothetical protein
MKVHTVATFDNTFKNLSKHGQVLMTVLCELQHHNRIVMGLVVASQRS